MSHLPDIEERYDHDEYGGDVAVEVDPDYEPGYCPDCSGSGEGRYDGSRCSTCKGKGEL